MGFPYGTSIGTDFVTRCSICYPAGSLFH